LATNGGSRKSVSFSRVNLKIAAIKFSPPKFCFTDFGHSHIRAFKSQPKFYEAKFRALKFYPQILKSSRNV